MLIQFQQQFQLRTDHIKLKLQVTHQDSKGLKLSSSMVSWMKDLSLLWKVNREQVEVFFCNSDTTAMAFLRWKLYWKYIKFYFSQGFIWRTGKVSPRKHSCLLCIRFRNEQPWINMLAYHFLIAPLKCL